LFGKYFLILRERYICVAFRCECLRLGGGGGGEWLCKAHDVHISVDEFVYFLQTFLGRLVP